MENLDYTTFDEILSHLANNSRYRYGRNSISKALAKYDLDQYFNRLLILGLIEEDKPRGGSYEGVILLTPEGRNIALEGKPFADFLAEHQKEKTRKEQLQEYQFQNEKHTFRTNSVTFYLMLLGALTGFYAFLDSIFKLSEKIVKFFT